MMLLSCVSDRRTSRSTDHFISDILTTVDSTNEDITLKEMGKDKLIEDEKEEEGKVNSLVSANKLRCRKTPIG